MATSFPFFHAKANGRSLWTSDAAAVESFKVANPETSVRTFEDEEELSTHEANLIEEVENGESSVDAETRHHLDLDALLNGEPE